MMWGPHMPHPEPASVPQSIGATNAPCVCTDDAVDMLRDLLMAGIGQWEASRRIWGKAS